MGKLPPPRGRLNWTDTMKAFAIFFVVYNHNVSAAWEKVATPLWLIDFTNAVHLFNVSSFYFVAGIFVERSVQAPTAAYLGKLLRVIYYPMVLWSIIQGVLYSLHPGSGEHLSIFQAFYRSFYAPHKQTEFLLSLLCGRLIFLIAHRLRMTLWQLGVLALTGVGYYCYRWIDHPIPLTPGNLMWMVLGAAATRTGIVTWIQDARTSILALTQSAFLMLFLWALLFLSKTGAPAYLSLMLVQGGAIGVLGTSAILLDRFFRVGFLHYLGTRTLELFLAHLIFVAGTRLVLLKLHTSNIWLLVVCCQLAGILGPLILVKLVGKRWLFEFPQDALAALMRPIFGHDSAPRRAPVSR